MLRWVRPDLLWLGLVLLPITFFYFLRTRFRRLPVSSTYIWKRLRQTVRGGTRLRWWSVLLLLIQLLAAACAVFAVSEPFWETRLRQEPGKVLLLDDSASMGAMEDDGNRMAAAYSLISEEIAKMPRETLIAVFLCSSGARLLAGPTMDRGELLARLQTVPAGEGGFDEARTAEDLRVWMAAQNRPWEALLISDGGLDLGGKKLAGVFGYKLRTLFVGTPRENLGLSDLRLIAGTGAQFYVTNSGQSSRLCRVRLERDGTQLAETVLEVRPGLSRHILPLRSGEFPSAAYTVLFVGNTDALAADDLTRLAVNPARPAKVLLIGRGDPYLASVLRRPGIDLTMAPVFPADLSGGGWDLIVADRVSVPAGLDYNLLAFGVAPPDAPVRLGSEISGGLDVGHTSHPLTRFMDWGRITVHRGLGLITSDGAQVLASVEDCPVLAAWEREGRRQAVWGTTLSQTDLGLSGAFPIFIQNFLQWCVPQMNNGLAYTLTVGKTVLLAEPDSWSVDDHRLSAARNGAFVRLQAAGSGVFTWSCNDDTGVIVANIPADESEITPRSLFPTEPADAVLGVIAGRRRPLSGWALLLLLGFLCAEWIMWRSGWRISRG